MEPVPTAYIPFVGAFSIINQVWKYFHMLWALFYLPLVESLLLLLTESVKYVTLTKVEMENNESYLVLASVRTPSPNWIMYANLASL